MMAPAPLLRQALLVLVNIDIDRHGLMYSE